MAKVLSEHGYDKEEEYFYRKNKELLDKIRAELDAKRAAQEAKAKQNEHWMKCPKCGHDLEEVPLLGIIVDQCANCMGIFFNKGELDLLFRVQEPKGFLGGLRRLFRK
jgi:protein-arginine kinase activator protein McsA